MADNQRPPQAGIPAEPIARSGPPPQGTEETDRSPARAVANSNDAESAVRALIAAYLRPPAHCSSKFHCL